MRRNERWQWLVVPAAAMLLALAACGGDEEESDILPTFTTVSVTPSTADPVVFLQKNPADTNNSDNIVMLDVMLRHTAGVTFTSFTLEVTFDPGVVQVGQINASATPLGECNGSDPCAPLCVDNLSPSNATPANASGDLVLGVASKSALCTASVTGTDLLLTISFFGSSVGTSPVTLVDGAGPGDCEILDGLNQLPIPCDSGGATITVAR